jgi:2-oxoglutarate decarboxylase
VASIDAGPASASDTNAHTDNQSAPSNFGANEWLVEDMYERYLADPASVDAAWHDFFDDYRGPGAPTDVPTLTPVTPAAPATAPAAAPSAPAAAAPASAPTTKAGLVPAGDSVTLRGAAARVVTNMELSLTVPTATSVRAVPAKLLADNRVVINNHLRRARGGKVSFTHIIGFAIVRALADYPEMNNAFAEIDGKPAVVTPDHINLGIAIDLVGKEGARSLVVASIKACETLDFAGFWNAYEDIIRRARAG